MNIIKKWNIYLTEHYFIALLFLALIALTMGGLGNVEVVSVMGAALCLAGCLRGAMAVDLKILVPLLVFDVFSMASSLCTFGTIAEGFAPTQTIFTVLYLLMAYLDENERLLLRRLCILWVGGIASLGVAQFTIWALTDNVGRLSGVLGNPNALGIFLVIGWFALWAGCGGSGGLERLEPVILAALALTLSMGSFLSMAVGLLVALLTNWRGAGLREAVSRTCHTLARATIGIGVGLLLYIAGRKTDNHYLCILLVLYLLTAALDWKAFSDFLRNCPKVAGAISVAGIAVTGVAIILRPSAVATFSERLEMMASGTQYILKSPLLGIGPYRWRLLDYNDGGTYFNTWHIHNLFLHIGVELGLIAMAALIIVAMRHFFKRGELNAKCGSAAFLLHCMIDTGFFYEAVPALMLLTVSRPREGGRQLGSLLSRVIFVMLGAVFIYDMLHLWL